MKLSPLSKTFQPYHVSTRSNNFFLGLFRFLTWICYVTHIYCWYWLIDYGANGANYYLTYLCAWNNGYFYLDKLRIFSALVNFISQYSVVCALADDTDRMPGLLPDASLDVHTTRGHKTSSYPRQGTEQREAEGTAASSGLPQHEGNHRA